jgi:hypothetical protein
MKARVKKVVAPEVVALRKKEAKERRDLQWEGTDLHDTYSRKLSLLENCYSRDEHKINTVEWTKGFLKCLRNWADFLFKRLNRNDLAVEYKALEQVCSVLFYVECHLEKAEGTGLDVDGLLSSITFVGTCLYIYDNNIDGYNTYMKMYGRCFVFDHNDLDDFLENLEDMSNCACNFAPHFEN